MTNETTPKQSEQMMKTQEEMNRNREAYTALLGSSRKIDAFDAKTEEGKKKKAEELLKAEQAMNVLDIRYKELLARLEVETIEFMVTPDTTEPRTN